uniref:Uncharacterized protein n=1 Tax=Vespula pensylvanica TaxID=30213 RepID=A0A834KSU7_VESPE|nr:hypothetical protein H0235_013231 [Vespula pensylvanica]
MILNETTGLIVSTCSSVMISTFRSRDEKSFEIIISMTRKLETSETLNSAVLRKKRTSNFCQMPNKTKRRRPERTFVSWKSSLVRYNKLFTSTQKISLNYGTRTRLEFFEGSFTKKRRKVKCSGFWECKRNYITRAQSELHSSAITVHEIPARHNAQWKTLERDCEKSTLSTPFSTLISQCQAQVPAWRA